MEIDTVYAVLFVIEISVLRDQSPIVSGSSHIFLVLLASIVFIRWNEPELAETLFELIRSVGLHYFAFKLINFIKNERYSIRRLEDSASCIHLADERILGQRPAKAWTGRCNTCH